MKCRREPWGSKPELLSTMLRLFTVRNVSHLTLSKNINERDEVTGLTSLRQLYDNLLFKAVIAQTRSMDMKNVLFFSLGPVPLSLADSDGSLAKTLKSKLLHLLESSCDGADTDIPPTTAWLVDGMAFLQSLSNIPSTFNGVADLVYNMLQTMSRHQEAVSISLSTATQTSRLNLVNAATVPCLVH